MTDTLGIAGAGTIATGLAVLATTATDVILWARSDDSAARARTALVKGCERLAEQGADAARARVVTELAELGAASFLVEAIAEDRASKTRLLAALGAMAPGAMASGAMASGAMASGAMASGAMASGAMASGAMASGAETIVATTTSSLSVADLARDSGVPERFVGFHVFNPVPRMALVEVVFPPHATAATRARTFALCDALGKTAIEVPDTPGFVVNRLLFPYLFDAVNFLTANELEPEQVDTCMTLGAGLPIGPLALLDFVGLDVARAIGESIGLEIPSGIEELVAAGALGRKAGRGFYTYP